MASVSEPRPVVTSPNIQDAFLNHARRERLTLRFRLVDGTEFDGRIKNFDRFAIIVDRDGADQMIFKHAVATVTSPRAVGSYYTHQSQ
ncbi:MAG: hfq [Acidobacteria bacterium]|jgi:host factor-I protein|nr:hfq [Acidobacteriota bacterium]